MSTINSIKNAVLLTILAIHTHQIQMFSLTSKSDIFDPIDRSVIYLTNRSRRNPFNRKKQTGGGHLIIRYEINYIQI